MKSATLLVLCPFLLVIFSGCSDTVSSSGGETVIKGVLLEVNGSGYVNCWKKLKFEGGLEALIRSPCAERWYIGHYQEITVDSEGKFVSNKCDSYDDLAADFRKRPYELPALVSNE